MKDKYYSDFPAVPIGGDNPYHCCKDCGISVPEINGRLDGHHKDCAWRHMVEDDLKITTKDKQITTAEIEENMRGVGYIGSGTSLGYIHHLLSENKRLKECLLIIQQRAADNQNDRETVHAVHLLATEGSK